ncbi:MAG: hypothetical protein D6718_03180 [Acidobacteria bacterium]|nr:MAG: hypothetical protein D6718_03180 [Acidobacteriota bacterium]
MSRRTLAAAAAVFVLWAMLDFVIHGMILRGVYERTERLWRPEGEMRMGLMYLVLAVAALCFTLVYERFVGRRNVRVAVLYGLLYGVGTGVSMGFGTYSVMPIPQVLAVGWFAGAVVEATAGGLVLGLVIRE